LINRKVSEVSQITLGYTDPGSTLTIAGGNSMAFAALVIARKGQPGKVLSVTSNNWKTTLGKPYHPREGFYSEPLRHIADAVKGGPGSVVRVMPADAQYPVLTVGAFETDNNTVVDSALNYGSDITLAGTDLFAVYMIDGDNELVRSLDIVVADTAEYGEDFFELTLTEKQADDSIRILETQVFSFDLDAMGVDNLPAFLEDKLENNSTRLRAITNPALLSQFQSMEKIAFAGGTSGDASTISTDEYTEALNVLRAEDPAYQAIIAAGCYDDTTLINLEELADNKNIEFFYDIEPNLPFAGAVDRQIALALNSRFAAAYHCPLSAIDSFYNTRSVWGLSGFVFAAKAAAVATKSPTGGWHLTPAGESRATLNRSNLQLNANAGVVDELTFVNARVNKLGKNSAGQWMIDDSLTTRLRKDYLRFENVVAVDCAIGRDYVALARAIKHEPDGVTLAGLTDGMIRILDGYVSSECLVPPRDPDEGENPYVIYVEQLEIDLWEVRWDICVAGSARRIIGQARLLR
jgi:hypothetical protein